MSAGAHPLRGRLIDIGEGRRMRIVCEGPKGDGPTVLFEAGAFGLAADWGAVQDRLTARGMHSCAYDRAGLGWSDPGPEPRDGLAIVQDLEKLLHAAGESGPYILVGHSMAGLRVRTFALRHPDRVAGLVLVDATTAEAIDTPPMRNFVESFANASSMAGWAAGAGLFKPLAPFLGDSIGLKGAADREKKWAFAHGPHNHWAAEEVKQWVASAEQAKAAGELDPDWPVAVITAGRGPHAWKSMQAAPAERSRHGYYRNVDDAHHASLLGERFADEIVKGIEFVRSAAAAKPSAA
jgi:pimeloyl-ACP methyl ester carboxylesterase